MIGLQTFDSVGCCAAYLGKRPRESSNGKKNEKKFRFRCERRNSRRSSNKRSISQDKRTPERNFVFCFLFLLLAGHTATLRTTQHHERGEESEEARNSKISSVERVYEHHSTPILLTTFSLSFECFARLSHAWL